MYNCRGKNWHCERCDSHIFGWELEVRREQGGDYDEIFHMIFCPNCNARGEDWLTEARVDDE